ncbi:transglycosylase domain-containing protein [Thiomonas sp. FB-Cd]|uniref:transglycosylase domain-containing protein n=1 Tax=Thiomonas sp. FB-Cd TaxID=1158292 RepID=UPI000690C061|nr:transglycosylase domain-containing protein [Thiomonas sp. FB-Cd]
MRSRARLVGWGILVVVVSSLAAGAWFEARTSWLEAHLLSRYARSLTFTVSQGPSDAIVFPRSGPYDLSFGYALIPQFAQRLQREGFIVAEQARMSPRMLALARMGLYPPYREKDQAGLVLRDAHGISFYAAPFPASAYANFAAVPPLLVRTLLYIEDRDLLDADQPMRNPAVSWSRFSRALFDQARSFVEPAASRPGGSTLATQIEKFRHSPGGRTGSDIDKLQQMASASTRAYLGGVNTLTTRQRIVVDYLNTVPLAARPGLGAIHGLRDGLRDWYGRDPGAVDVLLRSSTVAPAAQALVYKQALSLMIAQRAPTHFLLHDPGALDRLTDNYLMRLGAAKIIPASLRDAALRQPLQFVPVLAAGPSVSYVAQKAATAARVRLSQLLGMRDLYALDHLDLGVRSTLDDAVQRAVTARLRAAATTTGAESAGLYGHNMLLPGADPAHILFSFTLYEHVGGANLLRVQTDSGDQPFDINQGARLNLGSTAKLRTIILYLQIVWQLHERYAQLDAPALRRVAVAPQDPIKAWALRYLETTRDRALLPMLCAALQRTYSGNPGEAFFTGGSLQRFSNFDADDDHAVLSLATALQHSVNLVFVRLMRDIVRYEMDSRSDLAAQVMRDPQLRIAYLRRFAESEGAVFVERFYRKYRASEAQAMETALLANVPDAPYRKAAAILGIEPRATPQRFAELMRASLPTAKLDDALLDALYERYAASRFDLSDRGFLARVHPLELWVVSYLLEHPQAALRQTLQASQAQRLQVYAWLFRTHDRRRQDMRIRMVLEAKAYQRIAAAWRGLGYPFATVTPSFACALGASGDRPAALAELIGIVVNGGMLDPVRQFGELDFATGTPYATRLTAPTAPGRRVLPAAIAEALRPVLLSVVDGGTGVRLRGAYRLADGSDIAVGGKTGTGDQRFDVYSPGGRLIESRRVKRSATFVFFLGDRFFGTITAYAREPYAARYRFTSALTVELLRDLAPQLMPLIAPHARLAPQPPSGTPAAD